METRIVIYYTILQPIKFTDGFEIKAGQKVMLIKKIEDSKKWLNVQLENHDEKRIFWVESNNVKLHSKKKERWPKSKVNQYEVDVNEKWLENEGKNTGASRAAGLSEKPTRGEGNIGPVSRGRAKISKNGTRKTGTKKVGRKSTTKASTKKTTTKRGGTKTAKRTRKTK